MSGAQQFPPMSDPGDLECCILWEACVGSVWEGQHPVGEMSPGGEAESDCRNGRDQSIWTDCSPNSLFPPTQGEEGGWREGDFQFVFVFTDLVCFH